MKGKFQNTTIVMMGCEGLSNTKMAEALVEKGAKVYIGWSGTFQPPTQTKQPHNSLTT